MYCIIPILQVRKVRLSKVKQAKITQPVNEFKPEQYDCQAPALKHYTSHYLSSHYLSWEVTVIKNKHDQCKWSGKYVPMTAASTGKRKGEEEARNRS